MTAFGSRSKVLPENRLQGTHNSIFLRLAANQIAAAARSPDKKRAGSPRGEQKRPSRVWGRREQKNGPGAQCPRPALLACQIVCRCLVQRNDFPIKVLRPRGALDLRRAGRL